MKNTFHKTLIAILLLTLVLTGCIGAQAERTVRCLTSMVAVGNESDFCRIAYEGDKIIVITGRMDSEERNSYDLQGRILESASYDNGELYSTLYTAYNENGQPMRTHTVYTDDTNAYETAWEYDDTGLLILKKTYLPESGKVDTLFEYTYDENGLLLNERNYYSSDDSRRSIDYETDATGAILRATEYQVGEDGSRSLNGYWAYEYDDNGNLLSKIWNPPSRTYWAYISERWQYDESGRVTGYLSYGLDPDEADTVEYIYDEAGYMVAVRYPEYGEEIQLIYEELTLEDSLADAAEAWAHKGFYEAILAE